ncbi:MAG: LCP family protein [Oscillospiraceae bacterium]|nr:LCP family protein [Oscillospiraceae bacterium]
MVVIRLDILPYVYLSVFILILMLLLEGICLFAGVKVKGRIALWRRITTIALALIISAGCVFGSKLVLDAQNLLDDITGDVSDARSMYVFVGQDDSAQTIEDAKEYTFGALEKYDVEHTEQILEDLTKKIGGEVNLVYYERSVQMVEAFYSGEINALIMNGASVSLLTEQEEYEDFLSQTRVLYTHAFEEKKPATEENDIPQQITKDPFVVYIGGSDTRSNKLTVGRNDVNIIAVVNPTTKQILLVNTPRDYYVPNPAGKGELDKLTHCGNYGVDCSVEALEHLYGVNIDHYARINFAGFEKLIDAIGGVTVYSESSFTANHRTPIVKGQNTLNGQGALDFSRERYNVSGGDNGRGKNQMKVLKAVIEKLTSSSTLISKYADIISSLEGMFSTNFTSEEISGLVKMQLRDMASWDIQSFAVTGKGGYAVTYSAPGMDLYVSWPNEDTVNFAKDLMKQVMDGKVLTADDMVMPK